MTNFARLPIAFPRIGIAVPSHYFPSKVRKTIISSDRYIESQTEVTFGSAGGWLKWQGAQTTVTSSIKGRTLAHHLYVDVPTITQAASSLVFLVCLFALLIWAISGFVMIHPFIALITMIGCIGFYIMGMRTKQSHFSQ